jgi:steroid delta-isomerase-like uncharacterized protein
MQTSELIKLYYDRFNEGDMQQFLALLDDDVVHDLNQGERQIGKAQFGNFMRRMNHSYKENIKKLIIMVSSDNQHAAAEYVVEGTYLATDEGLPAAHNQKYVIPGGAFFVIQNGKIARVTNYYNLNDWLAQVTK